ncbi:MAG: hypothetical protein KAT75_04285 [Dehalococcoidia bacterium]|nr:hypothetical protein [Dehalococcoidia bacterium]
MPQQVRIRRTTLNTPTIDDPERKTVQIEYTAGELPPHFIFVPEKEWTKELEVERIKADMKKRLATTEETLTL